MRTKLLASMLGLVSAAALVAVPAASAQASPLSGTASCPAGRYVEVSGAGRGTITITVNGSKVYSGFDGSGNYWSHSYKTYRQSVTYSVTASNNPSASWTCLIN